MNDQQIEELFAKKKALVTDDHFVYAKKPDGHWYHGTDYFNKDAIYKDPYAVEVLGGEIAKRFWDLGVEVVIGPTVGGVVLAQWVAWHLGKGINAVCADEEDVYKSKSKEIGFVSTGDIICCKCNIVVTGGASALVTVDEKVGTRRIIKREYGKDVSGKHCLIVDDVINSGATVEKTIVATIENDGIVVGVGALCDRSGGKVTAESLGVPQLESLLELDLKMVKEEDCEQCRDGVPVNTELGKGIEFLVRTGKTQ